MSRMQQETVEVRRLKLGFILGIIVTAVIFWGELHVTWNIGIDSLGVHPFGAFVNHQEYILDGMLSIIRWPGSGEAWQTYYQTMQESNLVDSFMIHLIYPFVAAVLCGLITMYIVAKKRTVILREYPQRLLPHDTQSKTSTGLSKEEMLDKLMSNPATNSANPKVQETIDEKIKEGILLKNDPYYELEVKRRANQQANAKRNKIETERTEQKRTGAKRVVDQIRQDKRNLRELNTQRKLRNSASKFTKPKMEAPKVPRGVYDYNYVPQGNPLQWPVNPAKVVPGENKSLKSVMQKESHIEPSKGPSQESVKVEEKAQQTTVKSNNENKNESKSATEGVEISIVDKLFDSSNEQIKFEVKSIPDEEEKVNGHSHAESNIPRRLLIKIPKENVKDEAIVEIVQTPEERRTIAEFKLILATLYGLEYDHRYRRKEAQYLTGEISELEFNDWLADKFYTF